VSLQRILLCLALVVVCALCFPRGPIIGDEWLPITPEELKMTSEPKAPGAPAIYLYRQVDRDDKNTASSEYNYLRIKILTEEGRKYANIEIPFVKGRYNVAAINARTVHSDGSIVRFDGKVYKPSTPIPSSAESWSSIPPARLLHSASSPDSFKTTTACWLPMKAENSFSRHSSHLPPVVFGVSHN
jgi:hypothetical protein